MVVNQGLIQGGGGGGGVNWVASHPPMSYIIIFIEH